MFTKILYRPALAIVISIILLFLGVLGIKTLPIAQFPNIAPPTVYGFHFVSRCQRQRVLVESVLIPSGAIHQRRPEHAFHDLLRNQCR